VVEGGRRAPVADDELWWVLQHEGGTWSEQGPRAEDYDGRGWELTVRGVEVMATTLTLAWETAVQRPTWIGGHRRGQGGGALLIGVEAARRGKRGGGGARSILKQRDGGAEKRRGWGGGKGHDRCTATRRGLGRGPV
jgi:hypothetical protein